MPARAAYDREAIDAILDEALVAHLGFAHDDQPYVIPTLHARVGDDGVLPRLRRQSHDPRARAPGHRPA